MWKPSVCAKDCPDTCGLLAKVEDGRITQVKGDPDHPYTQGFLCRKAHYFPQYVHSPQRIATPLKRSGPKGSGRFSPISWDQAMDLLVERINQILADHGARAILPYYYAGHMGLVQRNAGHAYFNRLGASRMLPTICGPAAEAGFSASLGTGPSTDIESSVDSDYIVIWGSNTLSTNVHAWSFFQKARRKGARLVVVDPYRTRTAQKADLHLMPRPGTDAALALGMMQALIQEDLLDQEFIAQRTMGFDRLKERAAQYTPEAAARLCGVPADIIRQVAREYGQAKAPYIRTGWGPARQLAGGMALRTIALLPALVGAFKDPGGGITRSLGGAPADLTSLTRPDLAPSEVRQVNMVRLGEALTRLDDPPIKLLHVYQSNPAAVAPDSSQVMAGLAREDLFVVVQELFMTDTARQADLILPGASFLEMTDLYRSYGHNYLRMARPVIPPVGQSRPTLAIFQELAQRMGFSEDVFSSSEQDFIQGFLRAPHPFLQGVDLSGLEQGKAIRLNIPANPYAQGFNTPTGKVEFLSRYLGEKGLDPLPDGQPVRDPEGGKEFTLELITPPHHLFLNSAFGEIEELVSQAGPPSVLIHPQTADQRGISQGQTVRVFNHRGWCQLQAKVTTDTQPGLLVAEGLRWPSQCPGGRGINHLTSQRLTDMGNTCAFHCSLVEVEPASGV